MEGSPLSSTSTFSDLDEGLEELLNDSDMEIEDTSVNLKHLIKFHMRKKM